MQELEPKAALQQIALPINADKRAAGVAILSQLVWTADRSKLGMPRADFMRSVREQLTAAEQVRPWAILYQTMVVTIAPLLSVAKWYPSAICKGMRQLSADRYCTELKKAMHLQSMTKQHWQA